MRKALRRAEARPKNLAKSMEDITASLSPRERLLDFSSSLTVHMIRSFRVDFGFIILFLAGQERRQDPTADMRRISAGKKKGYFLQKYW